MADLIDRAQAMKLLSGEAVGKYPQSFCFGLLAATKEIDSLPAVDAVPVVRCKDCKFLWKKNMLCVHPKRLQGMIAFCECEENDYCSYGERRTDGEST